MRVLSPILRRFVYPALGKAGYFRGRAEPSIVTYHGVLPGGYRSVDGFLDDTLVSLESFRSHLRLLKCDYNVISPEHFRRWLKGLQDLPERAVLLTCDDGLQNNLTVMSPELQEQGMRCLFFVTSGALDSHPTMLWYVELYLMLVEARAKSTEVEWHGVRVPAISSDLRSRRTQWLTLMKSLSGLDTELRADFLAQAATWWKLDPDWKAKYLDSAGSAERFQLLNSSHIKQLADTGMEIGSHTISHPALSQQEAASAQREITDSRRELEKVTNRTIWALAYPFGNPAAVRDREFRLAKEAGYECAFMNIPGTLRGSSNFALPRVHVTAEMSLAAYEAHISGVHESLRRKFQKL